MKNQDSKIKLYIISGMGANARVFDNIRFNQQIQPVFIDWLLPKRNEDFHHYISRMAENIDPTEEFYLLGYSFGGILVQEIHKIKPAKCVVILASIQSYREKSCFFIWNRIFPLYYILPLRLFSCRKLLSYVLFGSLKNRKNRKLHQYFSLWHPYYLKWSIRQILNWRGEKQKKVIQILGDKDIVFPLKNSKPDYIIKGATHLFPITKPKEVTAILREIFV
ncbi:alpha/beta hydrolase [Elizabethkingia argentiflava]|uniref:Alpha/beta hydrolase n=1 Tax=Elizabethkingia argenteiflava TaxID=2681556 RepID=A0A845PTD2_9FLAO|nr:alpha/beta hydrolase [Elizabethkingia argenteiflava]NAW50186.1 alpha/beta hydrolase [Elizabethkingia argenteiflava]